MRTGLLIVLIVLVLVALFAGLHEAPSLIDAPSTPSRAPAERKDTGNVHVVILDGLGDPLKEAHVLVAGALGGGLTNELGEALLPAPLGTLATVRHAVWGEMEVRVSGPTVRAAYTSRCRIEIRCDGMRPDVRLAELLSVDGRDVATLQVDRKSAKLQDHSKRTVVSGEGIAPGRYTVRLTFPSGNYSLEVDLPVNGDFVQEDLQVDDFMHAIRRPIAERQLFSGVVLLDGVPMQNDRIRFESVGADRLGVSGYIETDASGRFAYREPVAFMPGTVISFSHKGCTEFRHVVVSESARAADTVEVAVQLETLSDAHGVVVDVLDNYGRPVAGIPALCRTDSEEMWRYSSDSGELVLPPDSTCRFHGQVIVAGRVRTYKATLNENQVAQGEVSIDAVGVRLNWDAWNFQNDVFVAMGDREIKMTVSDPFTLLLSNPADTEYEVIVNTIWQQRQGYARVGTVEFQRGVVDLQTVEHEDKDISIVDRYGRPDNDVVMFRTMQSSFADTSPGGMTRWSSLRPNPDASGSYQFRWAPSFDEPVLLWSMNGARYTTSTEIGTLGAVTLSGEGALSGVIEPRWEYRVRVEFEVGPPFTCRTKEDGFFCIPIPPGRRPRQLVVRKVAGQQVKTLHDPRVGQYLVVEMER